MLRILLIMLWGGFALPLLSGQDIIGLGTKWSDSFREWEVQTVQESRTGSLEQRWRNSDDWTQWEFRLGDTTAQIRQKWRDDPNLWEIKCLGTTVTARTIWNNDFRQWRLDDGTNRLRWQSRYSNIRDEWIMPDEGKGTMRVYTYWEGDPRDWVVEDNLSAEISFAMRLSMVFLAIYNSVPKQ